MMLATIFVFAMLQQLPVPVKLAVTSGRAQIGCTTVKQYESYHNSTDEKDGATPRTEGCVRLMPKTPLTDLNQSATATVMGGDQVTVRKYEAEANGKQLQLWLSPSAVEPAKSR